MTPDARAPDSHIPTYLSHWDDYGGAHPRWACRRVSEFCSRCGREMVETIEPEGRRSRVTGEMTFGRYHSCPTWVAGWRTSWWARGWACPGMRHDSHDADNPLSGRGYR